MSLSCQEHDGNPATVHNLRADERFFCIIGPIMPLIVRVCRELIDAIPPHARVETPGENLLHIHNGHGTARRYLPRVAKMF